ncbi:CotH kinase family protein [Candidatus Latescibacterota bacterium]
MTQTITCLAILPLIVIFSHGAPETATAQVPGTIRLNEIMPLNTKTYEDEDGEYSDWIEVVNTGGAPVSLGGYRLSDDPTEPDRWLFPDIDLSPGGRLVVFASGKDRTELPISWETVVSRGDTVRYLPGVAEPDPRWREPGFDDSGWETGKSGIGTFPVAVADGTLLVDRPLSLYIRASFTIDDADGILNALLHMDYDDAFVTYLNGHEIARDNIGTPGIPPSFDDLATTSRSPLYSTTKEPPEFTVELVPGLLVDGENLLAVQVHVFKENYNILGIPFLSLKMVAVPANPRGTPAQLGIDDTPRNLHTNFKIDANGETIVLSDPGGAVCDSITTGHMNSDISLGRSPDGGSGWMLFDRPTPGSANGEGFVGSSTATVTASLPNGFYAGSQTVSLSTESPTAMIRYTLDGSFPGESSSEYLQPIVIGTPTVVRAAAFDSGYLPGPVLTKSYLIGESSTIPVVSFTFDPPDLWDDDIGIYVQGNSDKFGGYPIAPRNPPANWNEDWERLVHMEFFEPDGTLGFETDAGGSICGSAHRVSPQKSLAIHFRDGYGLGELEYPLFPGYDITRFANIRFRNAGNDWLESNIRDHFHMQLFSSIGLETQANRAVHAYINGEYWGIMAMQEIVDADYLYYHYGIDESNVDIIDDFHINISGKPRSDWFLGYCLEGTEDAFVRMCEFMVANDLADSANYQQIKTMMNVDNYIDYLLTRIFVADLDGPAHNAKFWRTRSPEGRFRWFLYDYDTGSGGRLFGEPGPAYMTNAIDVYFRSFQATRSPDGNFLVLHLKQNEEFRRYFVNRYADLLNTVFAREVVEGILKEVKEEYHPEIGRHIARWFPEAGSGKVRSVGEWLSVIADMETFCRLRTQYDRANVIREFGLQGQSTLTLANDQPRGGSIRLNTLTISDPSWSGIYFKGNPVQLTAIPRPGYRFAGWSGGVTSTDGSIELDLTGDTAVTASFVEDAGATNTIQFTEINYNSDGYKPAGDWVEIHSTFTAPMDLTGWKFSDSEDAHGYTFPGGTVIAPDGYLVLCRDTGEFCAAFPMVENYIGGFNFGLSSEGEPIMLFDSEGTLVDSLTYGSVSPWPSEPDGGGPTLELKNIILDNSFPENWEASQDFGTPGIANDLVLSVDDELTDLPTAYRLGQNFPNPFNPVTTIPFDLPGDCMVTIEIFNALGQSVAVPLHRHMTAGSHTVVFDASDLPSGFLFYRMTAGTYRAVGKMLVMK